MEKFPDCSNKPLHKKWEETVALAHRRYGAYPLYHDDENLLLQFTPWDNENEMNSFLMIVGPGRYIIYRDTRRVLIKG